MSHSSPLAAAAPCPVGWTRPSVVREARQKWGHWCCFAGSHSNFYLGQKQTCMSEKNCAASVERDSARRSTATAGNKTNVRFPFLQKAVGCKLDWSHSTIVIWGFFRCLTEAQRNFLARQNPSCCFLLTCWRSTVRAAGGKRKRKSIISTVALR